MIKSVSSRLSWKLFLSYLAVILVGTIVLASAANIAAPTAFERHMSSMMGSSMGMMGDQMDTDLFINFKAAVNEALTWALTASFLAALVLSVFASRLFVGPIQEMTRASQRIASGKYEDRVGTGSVGSGDELAQLAVSFNQMAEKLSQTETMRRQLIGDVAHELRTPLTTIKGSIEGLLDGVLPPSPETYQEIYREADRLQRLVSDLQELSRVEAGVIPLVPKPVDLAALVESVTGRLRIQFDEKQVSLQVEPMEHLPRPIHADPDRITQVLVNLIGNALQYTPQGGVVRVSAELLKKGWVQLAIEDTGAGIAAEHLPHLFDRFFRADKSRSRAGGGSGTGLTISKYWVEAHGGTIWARSDGPGTGSTFYFTLPVKTGM
jgi:histidine kinase